MRSEFFGILVQVILLNHHKKHNLTVQGTAPVPRAAHTAVRSRGQAYIFGGRHREKRMNDLHCIDLETYTWSGE